MKEKSGILYNIYFSLSTVIRDTLGMCTSIYLCTYTLYTWNINYLYDKMMIWRSCLIIIYHFLSSGECKYCGATKYYKLNWH